MASSYYKLEIKNRTDIRSKGSKTVRRNGHVPGVLYYAGEDNVNISIEKSILFLGWKIEDRRFPSQPFGKSSNPRALGCCDIIPQKKKIEKIGKD